MDGENPLLQGSLNAEEKSLLLVPSYERDSNESEKTPASFGKPLRNKWWEPELPKSWPPHRVLLTCELCNQTGETVTEMQVTPGSWCLCSLLCFTFFWVCAWIPLCVNRCNQVQHRCSHCKVILGTYQPYESDY